MCTDCFSLCYYVRCRCVYRIDIVVKMGITETVQHLQALLLTTATAKPFLTDLQLKWKRSKDREKEETKAGSGSVELHSYNRSNVLFKRSLVVTHKKRNCNQICIFQFILLPKLKVSKDALLISPCVNCLEPNSRKTKYLKYWWTL